MENIELDGFLKRHFLPEWFYDEISGLALMIINCSIKYFPLIVALQT